MPLLVLALSLTAGVALVPPGFPWVLAAGLLSVVLGSLGAGQAVLRLLRTPAPPLLAFVAGFAVLANVMFAIRVVAPASPIQAGFVPVGVGMALLLIGPMRRRVTWPQAAAAAFAAAFTAIWCWDNAPRLASFRRTGELPFWLDVLAHAGEISSMIDPKAVGRGLALLADGPARIYHQASYVPAALAARIADMPALDAVVLLWIPLGILVMACGILALGQALARGWLGVFGLAAIALLPAPERTTLGNGVLGFAWLLETAPGTPYSIGIACAAFAMLVLAYRTRRTGPLVGALVLTGCCFFVRANTFIWLAPTVVLGAAAAWHRIPRARRLPVVLVGYLGLLGFLVLLSLSGIAQDPQQFLFGYTQSTHTKSPPTYVDSLYPWLQATVGVVPAGLAGVLLILLGTAGLWLVAFGFAWWHAGRARTRTAIDVLPVLLLAVAAAMLMLAPIAPNGDISEFRHRPGPLLVPVLAIWTLYLARQSVRCAPLAGRGRRTPAALGVAGTSLLVLLATIADAKVPRPDWSRHFYGTRVSADLVGLAKVLETTGAPKPMLAIANQPPDARNVDDALRLAALSGVPAYVSCSGYLVASGGALAKEAQRRLGVMRRLEKAPTLTDLRALMRDEKITHFVTTLAQADKLDGGAASALARAGNLVLYTIGEPTR